MALSTYSVSLTLRATQPCAEIEPYSLFKDLLNLGDENESFLHISKELGYLFHSEDQFNQVFEAQYGRVQYADFLSPDTLARLATL